MHKELGIQDDDLRLNHIPDIAECRRLKRRFKAQRFWPDIYYINDHGNVDLLYIGWNGSRIIDSWV